MMSSEKGLQEVDQRLTANVQNTYEQTTARLENLKAATAANTEAILNLGTAIANLFKIVNANHQNMQVLQNNYDQIETQLKGIQAENRRILDYLFGQQQ